MDTEKKRKKIKEEYFKEIGVRPPSGVKDKAIMLLAGVAGFVAVGVVLVIMLTLGAVIIGLV